MKPTGTRHDTLSQLCNEFGIVSAVSDPLQIFHQIVLLRAAEIEVELCKALDSACVTQIF